MEDLRAQNRIFGNVIVQVVVLNLILKGGILVEAHAHRAVGREKVFLYDTVWPVFLPFQILIVAGSQR